MDEEQLVLKVEKENRIYQFIFQKSSPLGELYDVLTLMRGFVIQQIQEENKPSTEKKDE